MLSLALKSSPSLRVCRPIAHTRPRFFSLCISVRAVLEAPKIYQQFTSYWERPHLRGFVRMMPAWTVHSGGVGKSVFGESVSLPWEERAAPARPFAACPGCPKRHSLARSWPKGLQIPPKALPKCPEERAFLPDPTGGWPKPRELFVQSFGISIQI